MALVELGEACHRGVVTLDRLFDAWAKAAFDSGSYLPVPLTPEVVYAAQSLCPRVLYGRYRSPGPRPSPFLRRRARARSAGRGRAVSVRWGCLVPGGSAGGAR